jgi:hypothetical protein
VSCGATLTKSSKHNVDFESPKKSLKRDLGTKLETLFVFKSYSKVDSFHCFSIPKVATPHKKKVEGEKSF